MLGKLARMLRMLGFDTIYIREGLTSEKISTFEGSERVILTRNTKFKRYTRKLKVFFPDHDKPEEQLKIVIKAFNLKDEIQFLSRCMECNELLIPVEKETIRGKVPFFVFDNHKEFYECPSCKRVYWEGTHVERMAEKMKEILG